MIQAAVIAASFLCLCLAFVLWLIRRAPEGHEDARGFRYGTPEKPEHPVRSLKTSVERLGTSTAG
ncbi:MAG TPA: hypothetical protein VHC86_15120 [Opitutaceae bacterium]|nr:hypothetical protein [Opitutaceae bacterium]